MRDYTKRYTSEFKEQALLKVYNRRNGQSLSFRVANKKQHMSLCMQKAVELHNGSIIKQSIIDKAKHFLVEYEIKTRNGVWLVTCDLDNGNITKEQQSN